MNLRGLEKYECGEWWTDGQVKREPVNGMSVHQVLEAAADANMGSKQV